MPVQDWTRVSAGLFHSFHLAFLDKAVSALAFGIHLQVGPIV
jgi:hypothetical protein